MNSIFDPKLVGVPLKVKYLICIVVSVICFFVAVIALQIGVNVGYKRGQLDYAQGKLLYTVIDGQGLKFLGKMDKEVIE